MTYNLGPKATNLLHMAAMGLGSDERQRAYEQACQRYSEKSVFRKLEELASRGYTEYGGHVRGSWLTDKGRAALAEVQGTDDVSEG